MPDDEEADWVYASLYPGASNGTDTRFVRFVGDDLSFFPFASDGTFRPGQDPNADPENDYVTEFISDIDGDASLGYIVTYGTPSWNSGGVNRTPARPGFWVFTITAEMCSAVIDLRYCAKQKSFRAMITVLGTAPWEGSKSTCWKA